MTEQEVVAYYKGLREGLCRSAWLHEGTQYVGSCGTTLSDALQQTEEEEKLGLELAKHGTRTAGGRG